MVIGYSGDGNTIGHVSERVSTLWGCTVIQGIGMLVGTVRRSGWMLLCFVCKDKRTEGKMDMARRDGEDR